MSWGYRIARNPVLSISRPLSQNIFSDQEQLIPFAIKMGWFDDIAMPFFRQQSRITLSVRCDQFLQASLGPRGLMWFQ